MTKSGKTRIECSQDRKNDASTYGVFTLLPSPAHGAYKQGIDGGVETDGVVLDGRAVEDVAHVGGYALTGHLQETLFHGPETEKGETGIEGVGDLMLLFVAHHRCHDVGVVTAQALHIDAHGNGVNGTCCGLMTVT